MAEKKQKHVLHVKPRLKTGSAESRRARRSGLVPSVLYGHGEQPKTFLLDLKEWEAAVRHEAQIVEIDAGDAGKTNAFVKEVQFDHLSGKYKHVDFLEVKMDESITATVPVHHIRTPVGLSQGGVLEQPAHEVEVECTPTTLPDHIEVDISEMEINDTITALNLPYPEGVKPAGDSDHAIFHVLLPRIEEEEVDEVEEGMELEEGAETKPEEEQDSSESKE